MNVSKKEADSVTEVEERMINKACEWWANELYYPSMTEQEVKWYKSKINKFRKEMREHLNGIK